MIDPQDDGTVHIDLEDGTPPIVLRRPKYGQYKRLQFSLNAIQDTLRPARDRLDALPETAERPEDQATLDAERRGIAEESEKAAEEGISNWWREVADMLGDRPFPESLDDWPVEMVLGGNEIASVIMHWRTVPLARGQMGRPTPSI